MSNPMTEEQRTLMIRLANILDVCLPYLDREAAAEARKEEGKSMRCMTRQLRAKAAHKAVAEAFEMTGVER